METENYNGSDCTGSNAGINRTLTLSNTSPTIDGGLIIIVDTFYLHPDTDFTIVHNDSSSVITFLNPIFDSQRITVHYDVSFTGQIPLGDTQFINNELDYFGTTITLRAVTDGSYGDYGDAQETYEDYEKTAFVQVLNQEDELVRESTFKSGDKLFWFKYGETDISRGNRIYHNSLWYEINEVIEHEAMGTVYIIEARTKKI